MRPQDEPVDGNVGREGEETEEEVWRFKVDVSAVEDGVLMVELRGDVDLYSAAEFRDAVSGPVDQGAVHIIVDATKVTFMDSTGLGVFVGTARRMGQGGSLCVACGTDVRRLFEIAGLDRTIRLVTTCEEARRALPSRE